MTYVDDVSPEKKLIRILLMDQSKMVNAWNGSDFVWKTYVMWTLTERKKMYEKCQFRNAFLIPKIDYHCHLCLVFFFFLSFNFSKISFLEGERKWFLLVSKRMNILMDGHMYSYHMVFLFSPFSWDQQLGTQLQLALPL